MIITSRSSSTKGGIKGATLTALALVALLFSFSIADAQVGWVAQTSGTKADLNGVTFTSITTGTAVGSGGVILRTTNSGATWTPQKSGLFDSLFCVSFFDNDRGTAAGQNGAIVYTKNGGSTWTIYQNGWMVAFYGVDMVTSDVAYTLGENTIMAPYGKKTSDCWQTSKDYSFYLMQGSVAHEGYITDIHLHDANNGYASATAWNGQGAIVHTKDGGSSWDTIHWTKFGLAGIDFPTPDVGYAVGNKGTIIKTIDGGATWQWQYSGGFQLGLTDVSFPSKNVGAAVGYGGGILRTADGGQTWVVQNSGTSKTLRSVDFPESNTGFIVGDDGLILNTVDGGGSPLIADRYELSSSTGGEVYFSLYPGTNYAWRNYFLFGSMSGTSPGTTVKFMKLPLNLDLFTDLAISLTNTPALMNFQGSISTLGHALGKLNTLGPLPSASVGGVMYFAYILYSPIDFVSNAVSVEIVK